MKWDEAHCQPKEATKEYLDQVKEAFVTGAKRAVEAGVDVIELHGAHGYFLNSFCSPASNTRSDEYGGSFENRIRYPLEVLTAVRNSVPDVLLFYRYGRPLREVN